jgi:hypothetical protein
MESGGAAAASEQIRQSLLSHPVASLALPELAAQVAPHFCISREFVSRAGTAAAAVAAAARG